MKLPTNSCTGNCEQGRRCTCSPENEPMTISDALTVVALIIVMLVALGTVGRWDYEAALIEQQIAAEVAR